MTIDDLNSHISKLNGIVMFFDKSYQNFKIYRSVNESKEDKNFTNPINISEYNLELLKQLITCSERNVRYNSSRIIDAKIDNNEFTKNETKDILEAARNRLAEEENIRVKALISNVLKKKLNISEGETNQLLFDAFTIEDDDFWKFELLIILIMNTDNVGLGKEALIKYKNTNALSGEREKLINQMIAQANLLNSLKNITSIQKQKSKSEKEKKELKSSFKSSQLPLSEKEMAKKRKSGEIFLNEEEIMIKKILENTLDYLVQNDEFLLTNDVCEKSISHKIAVYLERFFQPDCVDVEYNRLGSERKSKRIKNFKDFFESDWINHNKKLISEYYNLNDNNHEVFRTEIKKIYNSNERNKRVFPDIIVHKRGEELENFLVLEIKRIKEKPLKKLFDIIKLHFYKIALGYKYATIIQFDYEEISEDITITIHWIKDSENELEIAYELDEISYEKNDDNEFKNIEKLLNGISKVLEVNKEKLTENTEQIFIQMSKLMDKQSPIKHDVFTKAIENLEAEIGAIPIYRLADTLPENHKKSRYLYLLTEIATTAINFLKVIQIYNIDNIKVIYDEIKKEIKNYNFSIQRFVNEDIFALTDFIKVMSENLNFLQNYCMDFEIIYSNFVIPIHELLEAKNLSPNLEKGITESNSGLNIRIVKNYLERNPLFDPLIFLMDNLNAEIRNAIIHQNYYIDDEKKELVYYYLPKLSTGIQKIEMKSFMESYFKLVTAKLIWFVSIGKRLGRKG